MTTARGGYRLGIDVGTTYTAAAVVVDGHAEVLPLGNRALQVPSVLYFKPDGEVLVGEAAEARGVVDPGRLVREFKRRIGDPVPILVAGSPHSPQSLLARLLSWVVDKAATSQGAPPSAVVVTHPANWGPFKKDLLGQALRLAGLTDATTLTEPEAAAIAYASRNRMSDQDVVVVYDLGGGTFDVAVLRRTGDGFVPLGQPEGIEHLGGIDFDEALFHHVVSALPMKLSDLDADNPEVRVAVARLRRDCVAAKEALSADTETLVPVSLPNLTTTVRLTRSEFEAMIAPTLTDTLGAVRRAMTSAGLSADDVSSFVLVGGSSRIPLVSERLVAEFKRPVAIDTHPKHDVAVGAALGSVPVLEARAVAAVPVIVAPPDPLTAIVTAPVVAPEFPASTEVRDVGDVDGASTRAPSRTRRLGLLGAGAAVVIAALVAVLVLTNGGSSPSDAANDQHTQTSTTPPTATTATTSPTPQIHPGAWHALRPPGVALFDPGVVAFHRELWMVTGSKDSQGHGLSVPRIFNPVKNTWRNGPDLKVRLDHSAVVTNGQQIYVIGGSTSGDHKSIRNVYVLSSPTGSWRPGPPLPQPRAGGAAVWDGTSLIFAGGADSKGNVHDEVYRLDGNTWTVIGHLTPARLVLAAATDGKGTSWFIGGADHSGAQGRPIKAVDIVRGNSVTPDVTLANRVGAVRLAAAIYEPTLGPCVLGGVAGGTQLLRRALCPTSTSATVLPPLPGARAAPGATTIAGVVYVVDGSDGRSFALNSMVALPLYAGVSLPSSPASSRPASGAQSAGHQTGSHSTQTPTQTPTSSPTGTPTGTPTG